MSDSILNGVISNAHRANPERGNDYIGENGLLYCGKCHTPKQCFITHNGANMIVPCVCDCKKQEFENDRQHEENAKRAERIKQNRRVAFSSIIMQEYVFSTDKDKNNDSSKLLRAYAATFDPTSSKWLLLYGNCGTGKSFLAACVCNSVIDKGFTARFTSVSELANALWDSQNSRQEIFKKISNYDLLVLDDLYSERDTSYMQEVVFNIIDTRYRCKKPLIITTNLSPQQIGNPKGIEQERIFSRIYENSLPIKITGKDKRKETMMNTAQAELNKLLKYCQDNTL